jgi:hypothetical protein
MIQLITNDIGIILISVMFFTVTPILTYRVLKLEEKLEDSNKAIINIAKRYGKQMILLATEIGELKKNSHNVDQHGVGSILTCK